MTRLLLVGLTVLGVLGLVGTACGSDDDDEGGPGGVAGEAGAGPGDGHAGRGGRAGGAAGEDTSAGAAGSGAAGTSGATAGAAGAAGAHAGAAGVEAATGAAAGTAGSGGSASGAGGAGGRGGAEALNPACPNEPDLGPTIDWNSLLTEVIVAAGSPNHSAADGVINPDRTATLSAKFSYGTTSTDLEEEEVMAFICAGGEWHEVGTLETDHDGRADVEASADHFERPGQYPYRVYVRGDASYAVGTIYVFEPDTPAVVFDIDGTLTTDDIEAVEQTVLDQEPDLYPSAIQVVEYWATRGVVPIYLTGRFYGLDRTTRNWLTEQGFPAGPLFVTQSIDQWLNEVEEYKLACIVDLRDRPSLDLGQAYGNASTDICAYARAGIEPERTFIIGPNGGEACPGYDATTVVADYPTHLASLPP